jgi:hypothetical protein
MDISDAIAGSTIAEPVNSLNQAAAYSITGGTLVYHDTGRALV